jgi:hypothetical protein
MIITGLHGAYDKDAPAKVGARHTPSLVLILCALFVRGLTQAASLVSRVVNPYKGRIDQKMNVIRDTRESKPGWTVSKIFFFGLSCDMGILSKVIHEQRTQTRGEKLVHVPSYSGPSKYTLSPGLEFGGGCIISIPPSFPSLEVA